MNMRFFIFCAIFLFIDLSDTRPAPFRIPARLGSLIGKPPPLRPPPAAAGNKAPGAPGVKSPAKGRFGMPRFTVPYVLRQFPPPMRTPPARGQLVPMRAPMRTQAAHEATALGVGAGVGALPSAGAGVPTIRAPRQVRKIPGPTLPPLRSHEHPLWDILVPRNDDDEAD